MSTPIAVDNCLAAIVASARHFVMIDSAARKNLFKIVDAYAKGTGLSVSTISGRFYGNQAFLSDYREGRIKSMTLRKLDEFLGKLSAAWPDTIKWPKTKPLLMDRPAVTKSVKS